MVRKVLDCAVAATTSALFFPASEWFLELSGGRVEQFLLSAKTAPGNANNFPGKVRWTHLKS